MAPEPKLIVVEPYEDSAGDFRWRAYDPYNGNVLFISSEAYDTPENVDRNLDSITERTGWLVNRQTFGGAPATDAATVQPAEPVDDEVTVNPDGEPVDDA